MSYKKPDTGNAMNDYFTRLSDFTRLSGRLLAAADVADFERWLDKLIQIDTRSTVLFLKEHEQELPAVHKKRAGARLGRYLRGGAWQ